MKENIVHNAQILKGIIKVLSYFDVFHHPLSQNEIFSYFPILIDKSSLENHLQHLSTRGIIHQEHHLFGLHKHSNHAVLRLEKSHRAQQLMPKAMDIGRTLMNLPFIQSVCLSGTISKGVMEEESDIDYFIIAAADRVWLAKLSLKLYKIIRHQNSSKYLCYNYILSEDHLEIKAKNTYTATEINSLIPIIKNETYINFIQSNSWITSEFPNSLKIKEAKLEVQSQKKNLFSRCCEWILNNKLGDKLDNSIMNKIQNKYSKKYDKEALSSAMKSTKDTSKTHPNDMQKKILDHLEKITEDNWISTQHKLKEHSSIKLNIDGESTF